jgi:hypothetical protein
MPSDLNAVSFWKDLIAADRHSAPETPIVELIDE